MNDLLQLMLKRRSIRKFTGESIPVDKIKLILQAGLASATSKNRKPWEFVVVQEKETLKALAKCRAGAAKMLENAGCAIVVFGDTSVTSDVWVEDCSIAMSNMHLMADALGLGSCWIQGRCREAENGQSTESFCRELLGVPENYALEAILSVGVPTERPSGYAEVDLKMEKVHWERF
ncbi:MAG: nitroreductase family protein [Lachnospiraceae bacterium]|nr:nitroreductase family protein [Lachnospiraceae bacterium]MBP3579256.1 nitroreductase family protein [Lachnospiraceae bacterium]